MGFNIVEKNQIIQRLEECKIISIQRNIPTEKIVDVASILLNNGICSIEVTMNTKDSLKQLKILSKQFGERILLGAGTVETIKQAREAYINGATYFITPYVSEEVAAFATSNNIPLIMGAMTPTEIKLAQNLGADLIKVFPVRSLGPSYIKDILGPMDKLKIVAVGGIDNDNIIDYFNAGVKAVGLGGNLVSTKLFEKENWAEYLEENVKFLRRMVEKESVI